MPWKDAAARCDVLLPHHHDDTAEDQKTRHSLGLAGKRWQCPDEYPARNKERLPQKLLSTDMRVPPARVLKVAPTCGSSRFASA